MSERLATTLSMPALILSVSSTLSSIQSMSLVLGVFKHWRSSLRISTCLTKVRCMIVFIIIYGLPSVTMPWSVASSLMEVGTLKESKRISLMLRFCLPTKFRVFLFRTRLHLNGSFPGNKVCTAKLWSEIGWIYLTLHMFSIHPSKPKNLRSVLNVKKEFSSSRRKLRLILLIMLEIKSFLTCRKRSSLRISYQRRSLSMSLNSRIFKSWRLRSNKNSRSSRIRLTILRRWKKKF